MSSTYKGTGRRDENGVGGGGGWAARDRLNPLLGSCGLAMSLKSASHKPKHAYRA